MTPAEIYAEHNAPLVEGKSAPPASAALGCQCGKCAAHLANIELAAVEPVGDPA